MTTYMIKKANKKINQFTHNVSDAFKEMYCTCWIWFFV